MVVGGIVLLLVIIGIANGGGSRETVSASTSIGQAGSDGRGWTMPNLVGSNLQQAQDRIQSLTDSAIFYTSSHDATGAGRNQVLDRGWKVCDQTVLPGTMITASTRIDFGAVKIGESC